LLLLGARAGDLLGRRRVFVAGIALFTAASMLGGLAQSPTWLLGARALQGVGAAIAAPSTLALLTVSFPEGRERTRAVAYYSAVAGAGGSVGLVLGGMLTTWASWRWGLFINVPIGLALIWLAPRYLPETEPQEGRFDFAGAATSTLGMTALVYGLVRAADVSWGDPLALVSIVAAAVLLSLFIANERRAEHPITPLHLFSSRRLWRPHAGGGGDVRNVLLPHPIHAGRRGLQRAHRGPRLLADDALALRDGAGDSPNLLRDR
jgi:MFS family permease